MKFLIWAQSYDPSIGGSIVLHKLCHQLRKLGYAAYIQPGTKENFAQTRRFYHYAVSKIPSIYRITSRKINTNSELDTPLLPFGFDPSPNRSITIYPEIVFGNPFRGKHVVRWFLHRPGFHTGVTKFGKAEFHIDFNKFLVDYDPKENYLSPNSLYVPHYPFDLYNLQGALPLNARKGVAFCIRKGQVNPDINLDEATCIDGLPHVEIAAIFKRVKYFYSFDLNTGYSQFAALCGAISIVVPPCSIDKNSWQVSESDRFGVGFGLEEAEWALGTQVMALQALKKREQDSLAAVSRFAEEAISFFFKDQKMKRKSGSIFEV